MDRRTALGSCLATLALALQANATQSPSTSQGIFVPHGSSRIPGLHNDLPGLLLLSAKDTNGALSIFGGAPKGGAPLHFHVHQDEWWYVFEGEVLIQVADQKFHAKPGDCVFGPRGVPHSPVMLADRCSVITLYQPAGTMEEYFVQLGNLVANGTASQQAMDSLSQAHGMVVVGPPAST